MFVMLYGFDMNMRQEACVKMRKICVRENCCHFFLFIPKQNREAIFQT